MLIATIDLGLPIRLAGVGFAVVGFLLAAVMPEEGFRRPAVGARIHRSLRRRVGESVRTVRTHHILLVIPAIAAMHGFSKEGFDRLADYHFLNDIGLPPFAHLDRVLWFGVIDGGSLLLGVAATEIVRRKVDLEHVHGPARALAAIDGGLVILVVAFAFSGAFWPALVAFWLVAGLRSVREPVFDAWINRGIDPRVRATINSVGAQADAIGQVAGGSLGLIARATSAAFAIAISGASLGFRSFRSTGERSDVGRKGRSTLRPPRTSGSMIRRNDYSAGGGPPERAGRLFEIQTSTPAVIAPAMPIDHRSRTR